MKKGLAVWNRKRIKFGKLKKVKKRKRERRFRGVGFLVFSFLSKGVPRENIIAGEEGFPFFLNGERGPRE